MALFHDFDSEPAPAAEEGAAPPATPGAEGAAAPEPLVIVQYRRRPGLAFWVLPWLLVLIVGGALMRPFDRPIPTRRSARPVLPPAPVAEAPGEEAEDEPLVLQVKSLPAPAGPPVVEEPPAEEPTPEEAEAPERKTEYVAGPALDPSAGPRPEPGPGPAPEAPKVETAEVLASIDAEARRVRAQREEMARVREELPEIEKREQAAAQKLLDAGRADFHRAVRGVLGRPPEAAAAAIVELADRFRMPSRRGAAPEVAAELKRRGARLDRAGRIALLRAYGLSEPDILGHLVGEQVRMMPSRKAPRTREEAIVRAARQLLAVPPPPNAP